ncbi:uncharacterized protein LACBIDRAFT_332855 [Laccaria bicolor S238N-H82]|uniref:Predicted protein n=1 Tax=Laccaria bicolor (strain S238N-H82 / ATCC MYA-4686) TaxID=486041 RepID=B0DU32_LACBS|nr:uncharacterized protein LACBIDRAFT_332855 [Laccaria bicolor S238N-H82]EDR01878.1 predicted protein [Laccaria bicolor S238N-H82]|eukprot:XP_001887488.1 predicted protein [Laccaria bicolor S238N-H82]
MSMIGSDCGFQGELVYLITVIDPTFTSRTSTFQVEVEQQTQDYNDGHDTQLFGQFNVLRCCQERAPHCSRSTQFQDGLTDPILTKGFSPPASEPAPRTTQELRRRAVLLSTERKKLVWQRETTQWNVDFNAITPPATKSSVRIAIAFSAQIQIARSQSFSFAGAQHKSSITVNSNVISLATFKIRRRESPLPEGRHDVLQTWVAPWVLAGPVSYFDSLKRNSMSDGKYHGHGAYHTRPNVLLARPESATFEEGAWRKETRSHKSTKTITGRAPREHPQNQQQSPTNHFEPCSVLYSREQDEENRKIYNTGA